MNPTAEPYEGSTIPIRVLLPAFLTVALFVGTIFFLILPKMEGRMMADKRQMIRELTETAWSVLDAYHKRESNGVMTRAQAQATAVRLLRELRYGPENKDYYWINDMHPVLIMHPYRRDLEGRDISTYSDPSGKRLFKEFVQTVERSGSGYVDYQWQWKDDPLRIVPKISYVKGFEPWGWIIGTGIYVEDVHAEIAAITRRIAWLCVGILILMIALSTYDIMQNTAAHRRRREAQAGLRASEEEARLHREQLFQADKMATLGTLVSGVAHEINNPISSIILNAPILDKFWQAAMPVLDQYQERGGELTIGQMSYADLRRRLPQLLMDIGEGARRVKAIVSDLKDFARKEPQHMDDRVAINTTASKAVSLVGNLIKKSTQNFQAVYGQDIPLFQGNAQKIEQVIINLLVNACQALPDARCGIVLRTARHTESGRVLIEVRDQGCGISEDILSRIRDPFFTTKRESGGTGLGLSIAERIVEDHAGEMIFTSKKGQGTTVRVYLPALDHQTTILPKEAEHADGA